MLKILKAFIGKIKYQNVEIFKPTTEQIEKKRVDSKLKQGYSYLIKEKKPKKSFDLFTSILKGKCYECEYDESFPCESIGCERCTLPCPCKTCNRTRAQGLCITTSYTDEIREKYLLQITPILWLSGQKNRHTISPADLGVLANIISQFLKKSGNPVILLDGLEYLITTNGFSLTLRFLHDLWEMIALNKGILIMPLSEDTLEKKEVALLERYSEEINMIR
ncbi:MAG: DUF835 domain-containing protein [Methanobacterium sp.]